MDFFRGFLIWGLVAVFVGALCFAVWKFYFCRIRGFENRKRTTLTGCVLIFVTTVTYLFLPLVLCKSKLFTETKDRFVDGIKNDIVAKTRDAFYEEAEDVLKNVVDSMVDTFHAEKISSAVDLEKAKESIVKYAVKYSKNRTLKDSLKNAFKLIKIDDDSKEAFNNALEKNTLVECANIVERYSSEIRESYIQNSLLKPWIAPIVKNVSMESFTGLPADSASIKAFNKAKNAFDKLFLRFAIYLSLGTSIIIFIIIYLLREKEEKAATKSKRNYMFEYNEKSFEEMNAKKI